MMPSGVPTSSPQPTPAAGPTLAAAPPVEAKMPPRGTAVLARAKTGMMKKVESGESLQPYVLEAATVCAGVRARRGAGAGVWEITR